MAVEDGNAHAGGVHLNGVVLKDLARFPHHLHLLEGVAVVLEDVDLGNGVEGDLHRHDLRLNRLAVQQLGGLPGQFPQAAGAGAGDRLIGGDVDALDAHGVVDGLQRHHHLNGGAVGVGDDFAVAEAFDALRVHLRHHQGHIVLKAELGGVVDDHAAGRRRLGREFGGQRPAGGKQADPRLGEVELVKALHPHRLAPKLQALAFRALAGQQEQPVHGKVPLLKNLQQGLSDRARGPGDGHVDLPLAHGASAEDSRAASSASPIAWVPTVSTPSPSAMSAVRSPWPSTACTAASKAAAALGRFRL